MNKHHAKDEVPPLEEFDQLLRQIANVPKPVVQAEKAKEHKQRHERRERKREIESKR